MLNRLQVHRKMAVNEKWLSKNEELLWLISIARLGFGLAHKFPYYADTMGEECESESESVETCSA